MYYISWYYLKMFCITCTIKISVGGWYALYIFFYLLIADREQYLLEEQIYCVVIFFFVIIYIKCIYKPAYIHVYVISFQCNVCLNFETPKKQSPKHLLECQVISKKSYDSDKNFHDVTIIWPLFIKIWLEPCSMEKNLNWIIEIGFSFTGLRSVMFKRSIHL